MYVNLLFIKSLNNWLKENNKKTDIVLDFNPKHAIKGKSGRKIEFKQPPV